MTSTSQALVCLLALTTALAPVRAAEATPGKSGAADVVVDERSEQFIKGGLRYLASRQMPNGAWTDDRNHAAAITGYVLMAFLTTGQLPNEGEHGQTVRRGMDFLLECVRPDGYIAAAEGAHNMYGHGIATIALGEIYGMTNDDTIRPRLERAIKLIVAAQSKEGGWRYNPRPTDADVSVTVLQVVALRVAKNSGIDVPEETIERAVAYVRKCSHKPSGGFTYQAGRGEAGGARTAAAIYSLQVCGKYDDPLIEPASKYLFANFSKSRDHFTYGAYYAAPAHYMVGGDTWRKWYALMKDRISREAKSKGDMYFWSSQGPGGDIYGTAVYVSILAMPYGYVPLYQR